MKSKDKQEILDKQNEIFKLEAQLAEADKKSEEIRKQLNKKLREKEITKIKNFLQTHKFPFAVGLRMKPESNINLEVYSEEAYKQLVMLVRLPGAQFNIINIFTVDPIEIIHNPMVK